MLYICIIADDVEAFHDLWVIGDVFLKDTINTLKAFKNASKANRKLSPPYMYQHFNVLEYHNMTSSALKGIACQLNLLIEALNERPHLPKYIVVVHDRDIINETKCFRFGASYVLGSVIYYLIKQMNILLECQKFDLIDKKPGAACIELLTIIWTHMLKRSKSIAVLSSNKALSLRGRFNSVLEEWLAQGPSNLCLISINIQETDFNLSGYLTSAGKTTFWKEMDCGIMKFDIGKITLLPRGVPQKPIWTKMQKQRKQIATQKSKHTLMKGLTELIPEIGTHIQLTKPMKESMMTTEDGNYQLLRREAETMKEAETRKETEIIIDPVAVIATIT